MKETQIVRVGQSAKEQMELETIYNEVALMWEGATRVHM